MSTPISIDSSGECEKRASAFWPAATAVATIPLLHPVLTLPAWALWRNPVVVFFGSVDETARRLREGNS